METLCFFLSFLALASCNQNSYRLADSFPKLIDECVKDESVVIVAEGTVSMKDDVVFIRPNEFFKKPFNVKDNEKILMKFRAPTEVIPPNGWKLIVCLDNEGHISGMGSITE